MLGARVRSARRAREADAASTRESGRPRRRCGVVSHRIEDILEAPIVDADRRCGRGARSSCRLDQHICEGGARPVDHRRGQRGKHTEQLREQQVDGADDSSRIASAGAPELVCERGHGHPGGRELGESGGAIRSVGNRRQTCRERRIEECASPGRMRRGTAGRSPSSGSFGGDGDGAVTSSGSGPSRSAP